MNRKIELLINTSELTAGTRGASLGPGAIMTAARKNRSDFFGRYPLHVLPDFNASLDSPTSTPYAKYISEYTHVFNTIADAVKNKISEGCFPIVLAADHGSAAGTIAGIKQPIHPKNLALFGSMHTVIYILHILHHLETCMECP